VHRVSLTVGELPPLAGVVGVEHEGDRVHVLTPDADHPGCPVFLRVVGASLRFRTAVPQGEIVVGSVPESGTTRQAGR
jgi:hypothetical protein